MQLQTLQSDSSILSSDYTAYLASSCPTFRLLAHVISSIRDKARLIYRLSSSDRRPVGENGPHCQRDAKISHQS